VIYTAISSTRL